MSDRTRLRAAALLASVLVGVAAPAAWAVEGDRTTSVIAPPPGVVDGQAPPAPAGLAQWPVRAAAFPAEFQRQWAIFLGANDLIRDHPEVFVDVVRNLRGHVDVVAFVSSDRQQRRGQKLLTKAGLGRAGVRWERTSVHTMMSNDMKTDTFRYFMTRENFLARVCFDPASDQPLYGQVVDDEAEWCEFPFQEILDGGHEISMKRARRTAKRLGGTL